MDAILSLSKKANYIPIGEIEPAPKENEEDQKILDGNWTSYWIIGFLSSALFFAPFSFNKPMVEARERQPFGPFMKIHLYSAGMISLICLWNIFHTPSHGPKYAIVHRWLGRIGLVASIFAATFGMLTTWFERFESMGFSIGLSVLGIQQLINTFLGYAAIRSAIQKKQELKELKMNPNNASYVTTNVSIQEQQLEEEIKERIEMHKFFMAGLWVCCLAPAWFRIPRIVANAAADAPINFIAIFAATPFVYAFLHATEKKTMW